MCTDVCDESSVEANNVSCYMDIWFPGHYTLAKTWDATRIPENDVIIHIQDGCGELMKGGCC